MVRDWKDDLKRFEDFLKSLNLKKYAYLRVIKTVEQDLGKELLPLDIYYKFYWDTSNFKDYEDIFHIYWSEKLNPYIYNFIKKYFYGCSLQFVEEGFKARMYRIWMAVLTQFHFQYLWNALFKEKILSTPSLDLLGLDGVVEIEGVRVGIQIKKISYRREASARRFTKRQRSYADLLAEIPYLVLDKEEIINKLNNPRVKEKNKVKYKKALMVFEENFTQYENGFVVFKERYLRKIRKILMERVGEMGEGGMIPYYEFLKW